MNAYLKYGGLAFSAGLTISLFLRLFGFEAYGITLALAALVLFEGGTVAWSRILNYAEQGQRGVAYFALWYCAIVSVVSSAAEIILATELWTPPFDVGFVTLLIIAASLAVNLLGGLAYEQLDPDTADKHRELNRLAREAAAQASIEESFTTHAVMQAKAKAKQIAGDIADKVGESIKQTAVTRMTTARTFALDGDTALALASACGSAAMFTREQVEEMIAAALAEQERKRKPSRNGKSAEAAGVESESPKG